MYKRRMIAKLIERVEEPRRFIQQAEDLHRVVLVPGGNVQTYGHTIRLDFTPSGMAEAS